MLNLIFKIRVVGACLALALLCPNFGLAADGDIDKLRKNLDKPHVYKNGDPKTTLNNENGFLYQDAANQIINNGQGGFIQIPVGVQTNVAISHLVTNAIEGTNLKAVVVVYPSQIEETAKTIRQITTLAPEQVDVYSSKTKDLTKQILVITSAVFKRLVQEGKITSENYPFVIMDKIGTDWITSQGEIVFKRLEKSIMLAFSPTDMRAVIRNRIGVPLSHKEAVQRGLLTELHNIVFTFDIQEPKSAKKLEGDEWTAQRRANRLAYSAATNVIKLMTDGYKKPYAVNCNSVTLAEEMSDHLIADGSPAVKAIIGGDYERESNIDDLKTGKTKGFVQIRSMNQTALAKLGVVVNLTTTSNPFTALVQNIGSGLDADDGDKKNMVVDFIYLESENKEQVLYHEAVGTAEAYFREVTPEQIKIRQETISDQSRQVVDNLGHEFNLSETPVVGYVSVKEVLTITNKLSKRSTLSASVTFIQANEWNKSVLSGRLSSLIGQEAYTKLTQEIIRDRRAVGRESKMTEADYLITGINSFFRAYSVFGHKRNWMNMDILFQDTSYKYPLESFFQQLKAFLEKKYHTSEVDEVAYLIARYNRELESGTLKDFVGKSAYDLLVANGNEKKIIETPTYYKELAISIGELLGWIQVGHGNKFALEEKIEELNKTRKVNEQKRLNRLNAPMEPVGQAKPEVPSHPKPADIVIPEPTFVKGKKYQIYVSGKPANSVVGEELSKPIASVGGLSPATKKILATLGIKITFQLWSFSEKDYAEKGLSKDAIKEIKNTASKSRLPLGISLAPAGGSVGASSNGNDNKIREIIGPDVMKMEAVAASLSPAEVEQRQKLYRNIVQSVIDRLRVTFPNNPTTTNDIHELSFAAIRSIWSKYKLSTRTTLLVNYFVENTQEFDGDTCAFLVSDILSQFGVQTEFVEIPERVFLRVQDLDEGLYVDTSAKEPKTAAAAFFSKKEFLQDHPVIFGISAREPVNTLSLFGRGLAYFELGDFEKAVADFSAVIAINKKHAGAFANRGTSYFHRDNIVKAVADYERAIQLNPDQPMNYYNLGLADYLLGIQAEEKGNIIRSITSFENAVLRFDKAIKLNEDRNSIEIHYDRARANAHLARALLGRDRTKSLECFRQARLDYTYVVHANPAAAQARVDLANMLFVSSAYFKRGSAEWTRFFNESIAYYSEAIDLVEAAGKSGKQQDTDKEILEEAYFGRCVIRFRLMQYTEGQKDFAKLIQLNPTYESKLREQGVVFSNETSVAKNDQESKPNEVAGVPTLQSIEDEVKKNPYSQQEFDAWLIEMGSTKDGKERLEAFVEFLGYFDVNIRGMSHFGQLPANVKRVLAFALYVHLHGKLGSKLKKQLVVLLRTKCLKEFSQLAGNAEFKKTMIRNSNLKNFGEYKLNVLSYFHEAEANPYWQDLKKWVGMSNETALTNPKSLAKAPSYWYANMPIALTGITKQEKLLHKVYYLYRIPYGQGSGYQRDTHAGKSKALYQWINENFQSEILEYQRSTGLTQDNLKTLWFEHCTGFYEGFLFGMNMFTMETAPGYQAYFDEMKNDPVQKEKWDRLLAVLKAESNPHSNIPKVKLLHAFRFSLISLIVPEDFFLWVIHNFKEEIGQNADLVQKLLNVPELELGNGKGAKYAETSSKPESKDDPNNRENLDQDKDPRQFRSANEPFGKRSTASRRFRWGTVDPGQNHSSDNQSNQPNVNIPTSEPKAPQTSEAKLQGLSKPSQPMRDQPALTANGGLIKTNTNESNKSGKGKITVAKHDVKTQGSATKALIEKIYTNVVVKGQAMTDDAVRTLVQQLSTIEQITSQEVIQLADISRGQQVTASQAYQVAKGVLHGIRLLVEQATQSEDPQVLAKMEELLKQMPEGYVYATTGPTDPRFKGYRLTNGKISIESSQIAQVMAGKASDATSINELIVAWTKPSSVKLQEAVFKAKQAQERSIEKSKEKETRSKTKR